MIYFNRETLRDHIYACWMGKNIGGTMGGPYEWAKEILDVKGFVTKEGEVLPNDDLDLQLIWLKAMEEQGPAAVNEKVLGEYWLSYIGPHWAEYGICKSNLREGFVPPLSGEVNNDEWKNSNGAWIRSEIWACLFPGQVDKAIQYAYYDACVDHGYGEGMYAEIFTAALESMAFVCKDIPKLLHLALSKIPAGCRVSRSIRLVMEDYKNGVDWKDARNHLVEDSADLGWFMAPCNVAFAILGLLYGEGDFKKSMLYAINCGDDTDCTAATIGALMGILHGTAGLPEDWCKYMGDDIVTCCLLKGHGNYPKTCTELTDAVMNMLPVTLHDPFFRKTTLFPVTVYDDEDKFDVNVDRYAGSAFADALIARKRYSFTWENLDCTILVEFDEKPVIAAGGTLSGSVSVTQTRVMPEQKHYQLSWMLPEGWTAAGQKSIYTGGLTLKPYKPGQPRVNAITNFTLTAGDNVSAHNDLVLKVSVTGRSVPVLIPIVVLG